MGVISSFLDFLYPKTCVGCGVGGTYLCPVCVESIETFPFPLCPGCGKLIPSLGVHPACKQKTSLHGLIALGKHDGVLRSLVKHIKYYGHFDMVHTAVAILTPHVPASLRTKKTIVTSVPMHPSKERERGYNQSELLARELAQMLTLPYRPLLRKTKATQPQAQLKREERLTNLHQSFESTSKQENAAIVLLVDDVTTTRATLNDCAITLKHAGVRKVYGIVLAHGK